jgi:ribosome-associated protein
MFVRRKNMQTVKITTEFIKLDQFLKWVDAVSSGTEAKFRIAEEEVKVNGEIETRRGKKLYPGDTVEIDKQLYTLEK